MKRETKDLRLDLKEVNDVGTFDGYLSVYGVVDLGNDLVEKGAFTKTISEQKGIVPMLWSHDTLQPIGTLELSDDEHGLKVKGEFFLEESAKAREIYGLSKRFHEKGRAMGLSIGFTTLQKKHDKGVRYLKEIKLYEGSPTLFPMLPPAQITDIKAILDGEAKDDFVTELGRVQLVTLRHQMMSALSYSLDSILYGYDAAENMDAVTRVNIAADSIDQFRAAYIEHLPQLLDAWGVKGMPMPDGKAGRRLSAASLTYIQEAIQKLTALLDQGDESTSEEEAARDLTGAATKSTEPDALHSLDLSAFFNEWKAQIAGTVVR